MERHAQAVIVLTALASAPGSGQSVIDWNKELITILGTPKAQPAAIHPTRSFAILQAAQYDAVVSITHAGRPYVFSVAAPRHARPDAAADEAAHDVLAALYPSMKPALDQMLSDELPAWRTPPSLSTTASTPSGCGDR